MAEQKLIPVTKYEEGLRVQRGPDWAYDDQDGGAGNLGTLIRLLSPARWCRVRWDNGSEGNYRIGEYGNSDLALAVVDTGFHNPDNLTPEQVGEGYRLLYHSEIKTRINKYKSIWLWEQALQKWNRNLWGADSNNKTYCVPKCFPKDFTEQFIKDYESGINSTEMTKDGLLEEAKRRYPIGTEYKPLSCIGTPFSNSHKTKYKAKHWGSGKDVGIDCGEGLVYINGKWAEIVSKPETDNPVVLTKEQLDTNLCKHCPLTCDGPVNTGPHNLCEGGRCEQAYENYLDSVEAEVAPLDIPLLGYIPEAYTYKKVDKLIADEVGQYKKPDELPPYKEVYLSYKDFYPHFGVTSPETKIESVKLRQCDGVLEQITNLSELQFMGSVEYMKYSDIVDMYKGLLSDSGKENIKQMIEPCADKTLQEVMSLDLWAEQLDMTKRIKYNRPQQLNYGGILKDIYLIGLMDAVTKDSKTIANILTKND